MKENQLDAKYWSKDENWKYLAFYYCKEDPRVICLNWGRSHLTYLL